MGVDAGVCVELGTVSVGSAVSVETCVAVRAEGVAGVAEEADVQALRNKSRTAHSLKPRERS